MPIFRKNTPSPSSWLLMATAAQSTLRETQNNGDTRPGMRTQKRNLFEVGALTLRAYRQQRMQDVLPKPTEVLNCISFHVQGCVGECLPSSLTLTICAHFNSFLRPTDNLCSITNGYIMNSCLDTTNCCVLFTQNAYGNKVRNGFRINSVLADQRSTGRVVSYLSFSSSVTQCSL